MAAKPKPKGKNTFFTKKVGPLPVWAWVATAVGTYLAYRYFSGASASTTTPAATDTTGATGTPVDTSGLGGGTVTGSSPDTSGYQPFSDLISQLESQNASLISAVLTYEGGLGGGTTGSYPGGMTDTNPPPTTSTTSAVASKSPYVNGGTQRTIPASTRNFAQAAVAKTAAGAATGTKVAFGGVVSTKKLTNGATLTTYASGRQVEQAPGKSAYVVHQ